MLLCEFCYEADNNVKEYNYVAKYLNENRPTTLWLCSCCVEMVSKDRLVNN